VHESVMAHKYGKPARVSLTREKMYRGSRLMREIFHEPDHGPPRVMAPRHSKTRFSDLLLARMAMRGP